MTRPRRILTSVRLSAAGRQAIHDLASARGESYSQTTRALLAYALTNMPTDHGRAR